MEVVVSLSQGRTAAALCGLFTYKSVSVIFEPPCRFVRNDPVSYLKSKQVISRTVRSPYCPIPVLSDPTHISRATTNAFFKIAKRLYCHYVHQSLSSVTSFFLLLFYTTSRLQTISTLPKVFYTVSSWLVEKYPIEYPQLKCARTCGRCL